MDKKNLFTEFPPLSKQQWIEKATTDLKGAEFNEKLIWKSQEGFEVMPFYTKEDLSNLDYLKGYHNSTFDANTAHLGARRWQFRQIIDVQDETQANKAAIHALNQGAEALEFDVSKFNEQTNFELLLKEILFPYCEISFHLNENHFNFFQRLEKYLEARGFAPEDLKGAIHTNHISTQEEFNLVQSSQIYSGFRTLVISHKQAESIIEKIASLLHKLVNRIQEHSEGGIAINDLFNSLELRYEVGNNYFFEIAGLRALRMMVCGIANEFGLANFLPNQLHIHTQTSIAVNEETQNHPEWNMLSNTTQAMSAIIGGCNSLSILPHNLGISDTDGFSERIARNVSNILREEAYFDKVADPAAGSYYVENLTHQIAQKAWEAFQKML